MELFQVNKKIRGVGAMARHVRADHAIFDGVTLSISLRLAGTIFLRIQETVDFFVIFSQ